MIQNFSSTICTECREVIFNPLCPQCIANEVNHWLDGSPIRKRVQEEINLYISRNEGYQESMKCAVCRSNYADICPYCLTEHVYELLIRMKAGKKMLGEFLDFFNFDFEHSGYSKDFEEAG
jgi:hypothetical protein